jgi:DNA-binding response OmpR family regulator
MKIFILEDNAERMKFFWWYFGNKKFEIYHADNVTDAKMLFETNQPFDLFLLDHDLDNQVYVDTNNENTGTQFAKFLAEKKIDNIPIIIHSFNQYGAENMNSILKTAMRIPFPLLVEKLINKEITIE